MDPTDDFVAAGEAGGGTTNEEEARNSGPTLSASLSVTLPVPKVVQQALGTKNILSAGIVDDDDTIIYGLEGFLLPQYLSLRYKLQSNLGEGLRLAQKEELRDRERRQNIIVATRKPNKSKKKRKRKSTVAISSNNETDNSEPKRKRRRKNRKKGTKKESEELDDNNSNEMNHYRMMARIIVAPFTSSLIATMNRCKQSSTKLNDGETAKDATSLGIESASTSTASDKVITYVYTKQAGIKPTQNKSLTLLPPQESLECIVDGAICALVRRTHKFRTVPAAAAQKTVGKVNHRRRKRKTSSSQQEQCPRLVEGAASVRKNKKDTNANNWLLVRNLLSAGYVLGNSDTLTSSPKKKLSNAHQEHNTHNQFLRGCPNMAPGIHCLQPNTLATYARSSEMVQFLHSVIGDEALREILMNAVILIPAVSDDNTNSDDNSNARCFQRCNYFQLCGPPLNTLAKKFEQMTKKISLVQQKELKLRARKRKRDEIVASSNFQKRDRTKHTQSQWDANKAIPRSNLFYCDFYTKHVGLSPQHLLNQKGDEDRINFQLLNSMVHIWPKHSQNQSEKKGVIHGNKRRKRWRRLRVNGIAMCKEMRKRTANCNFSRLLEYHCILPLKSKAMDSKSTLSHLVTLDTPVENVIVFIQAVLRRSFPCSFWGSKRNFDQVVKTMTVYLNLRRSEAFPEKAIMSGIHVLDMKWLHSSQQGSAKHSRTDHESATVVVRNIMRWLYCHFINPMLRSTFYITETEFTGTRVLYYRRPVWMRIRNFSVDMLLSKEQYREMSSAKAQRLLSSHNIGCPPAPLRILPKKSGIRAIAMLSKTCEIDNGANKRSKKSSPPNRVMQSTFHALRYEHEKKPALFGAGVLGLTEVFPSFCSFVGALKQFQTRSGSSQELFFTSADIKHCYDTINQKRLFKLMRSMVEEEMYLTKDKFVLCSKGDNSVMRCMWKKKTCSPEQFSCSSPSNFAGQYSHAIFVDGVYCSTETNKTINGLLRDHIFGQVVVANGNFGPRYLHQKNGIPQGSILSSMFCNTYFGSLEKVLFDDVFDETTSQIIRGNSSNECDSILVNNPNALHLLLRIVDDFLLISTDKNASMRFLEKLNVGIPSLGVKLNKDKTRVNFSAPGRMKCDNQCQKSFPWCGLLINTATCEIMLDYERFSGKKAIDTVSVHRLGSEGTNLRKAMKGFVRPRCNQQLLFSSRINSIDSVRLNFYQTSLLCAIKTMHYIDSIGIDLSSKKQHIFVYDSVCDTIQYTFLLISSKLKSDFQLCWGDAFWLGKRAFVHVLKTKTERHKHLKDMFSESREIKCLNRGDLVRITKPAANLQFNLNEN